MEAVHKRDGGEGWRPGSPERPRPRGVSRSRSRGARSRTPIRDRRPPPPRKPPSQEELPPSEGRRIWIGGVRNPVDPEAVRAEFGTYGEIDEVETGFKGMAFVLYKDESAAQGAVDAHERGCEIRLGGPPVAVKLATDRGYLGAVRKRDEGDGWRTGATGYARGGPPGRGRRRGESRSQSKESRSRSREPPAIERRRQPVGAPPLRRLGVGSKGGGKAGAPTGGGRQTPSPLAGRVPPNRRKASRSRSSPSSRSSKTRRSRRSTSGRWSPRRGRSRSKKRSRSRRSQRSSSSSSSSRKRSSGRSQWQKTLGASCTAR